MAFQIVQVRPVMTRMNSLVDEDWEMVNYSMCFRVSQVNV